MLAATTPPDETERLAAVRALDILDTPGEDRFDRIVSLAKRMFDVPIAYLAVIDDQRQWFKAKIGLKVMQTPRDTSFCGHTILQDEPLIIPDAHLDSRFADNPMVRGEPGVRFYAGWPIKSMDGHNVATLCLVDHQPRELSDTDLDAFADLAAIAESEINMRGVIHLQQQVLETKSALEDTQRALQEELNEAAAYVQSLLPTRLDGAIRSDYRFIASSKLGGDLFGYRWLTPDELAIYLFDVTGHGVGAALLASDVLSSLSRTGICQTDLGDPAAVLRSLNRAFPIEENAGKFFTIWYGVYNLKTRELRYSVGGHHPAIALNGTGRPKLLGSPNIIIGVDPDAEYTTESATISPGTRIYLFSDGVFEVRDPSDGQMLNLDGFADLLVGVPAAADSRVGELVQRVQQYQGRPEFGDDVSLLELEFVE